MGSARYQEGLLRKRAAGPGSIDSLSSCGTGGDQGQPSANSLSARPSIGIALLRSGYDPPSGGGLSLFQISCAARQDPSGCLRHVTMYFPLPWIGSPSAFGVPLIT